MNNYSSFKRVSSCLAAATLLVAATSTVDAATALNGQIALRPLTPQEPKDYKLTGVQGASGLDTVGLGQPAYLEALVNIAVPAADVTNVSWTLAQAPVGSTATLETSPLGANVPPYKMVERLDFQVAGRTMLRPDKEGQYKVVATIKTASNGDATVEQVITGATYMGLSTCALCHSGGLGAPNKVAAWSQTGHAKLFTQGIDGIASDHYGKNCISCHTVGYDVNANAVNGGFDDIATQQNWTFPTVLTNGNWAALSPELKNLGNIQCENCHGPGSQHAQSLGGTEANRKISVTYAAGNCAQCHDSPPHHAKTAEWNNSKHAIAVEETESGCARCHSAKGFADFAAGRPAEETPYEVITCAGCHEPHDGTNPHQLRKVSSVTLMDSNKTVITEGGKGLMCMNCHISRRDAVSYADKKSNYTSRFGPHHGPQTDMLAGTNAVNYGKAIPSSAHKDAVADSCVTCHMQEGPEGTAAFTHVGGHTFNMSWEGSGTNGPAHMVEACVNCHGEIENFDFVRQDYDGNGVAEGVQTEVKGLLNKLALLLPPLGTPKDLGKISVNTNWTTAQARAGYNYLFVWEDGSYGVHNLSYAVGLLKASINDLTGDANTDGLPDWWQVQYFGSANDPNAAPNATPAGDGVPNWLKYSLGLDPKVAGVVVPNGVVWASGKGLVNPPAPGDNSLAIYTAAEIVFNSEVGKSYQIWGSSSMSAGWQKIGAPIAGTGSPISYVAPTREGTQQFYRVEHTP